MRFLAVYARAIFFLRTMTKVAFLKTLLGTWSLPRGHGEACMASWNGWPAFDAWVATELPQQLGLQLNLL